MLQHQQYIIKKDGDFVLYAWVERRQNLHCFYAIAAIFGVHERRKIKQKLITEIFSQVFPRKNLAYITASSVVNKFVWALKVTSHERNQIRASAWKTKFNHKASELVLKTLNWLSLMLT